MHESYIISFYSGSSGKFLKYILFSLLTNYKEELEITAVNSAHLYDIYTGSPRVVPNTLKDGEVTESWVYDEFNFDPALPLEIPKIMLTHQYPVVDAIKRRFSDTNLILITLSDDDWLEIIGNNLYKNGFDMFNKHQHGEDISNYTSYFDWLNRLYKKTLGKEFDYTYDIRETEQIVYAIHKLWKTHKLENIFVPNFANSIDLEKYSNLTEIKYSDLYKKSKNEKYIALEKLENLTGKSATSEILKNYEIYMNGRNKFIQKSMPWLLKEKSNN
jgi:hypothetical protein